MLLNWLGAVPTTDRRALVYPAAGRRSLEVARGRDGIIWVCGYFNKRGPGLKMPKTEGKPHAPGIRYEGPVLNGSMSVDDAFAREKQARQLHAVQTTLRTGVRTYVSPEGCDRVLRYHTRTGKPQY